MSLYTVAPRSDELMHFGVLGMKWGIRRYQPYSYTGGRKGGKTGKEIGEAAKLKGGSNSSSEGTGSAKRKGLSDKQKKAIKNGLKVGAVVAGTALAAYGGYKLSQHIKTDKEQWDQVRKFGEQYTKAKGREQLSWDDLQDVGRAYGTKGEEWDRAMKTWQWDANMLRKKNYEASKLKARYGKKESSSESPMTEVHKIYRETVEKENPTKSTGIKLEFGGKTADKGNDYTDRILKANQSLGDIAKSANDKINNMSAEDFTAELLKKANKKLK